LLFWGLADFQRLRPGSEGSFTERALLVGVTELGTFAFVYVSSGPGYDRFWGGMVVGVGSRAAVAASRCWPARIGLRWLAILAAMFWFFWGFCITGLRITWSIWLLGLRP
jgi:hypothetical protein